MMSKILMCSVFAIMCLAINCAHIKQDSAERVHSSVRSKRSIEELGLEILCETGYMAEQIAHYGCYCSGEGKGNPVDELDGCCKEQIECYKDAIVNDGCTDDLPSLFTVNYDVVYVMLGSLCGDCAPRSDYKMDDKDVDCKVAICKCDHKFADCLGRNKDVYNEDYDINSDLLSCE